MVLQHLFGGDNKDSNSSGSSNRRMDTGGARNTVEGGAERTPLVAHQRSNSSHSAGDNFYFARSSSSRVTPVQGEATNFTTYDAVTTGGASDSTSRSSGAGLAPPSARNANVAPVQAVVDDDSDFEEPIPSRPIVSQGSKPGVSFWQKIISQKKAANEKKAAELERKGNVGNVNNGVPMSKPVGGIKVEPKVFFSNERTFIAWLHTATLLAGGSLAIVAFSEKNETSQLYGLIMLPVAIIFLVYALAQYDHRSRMIRKREAGSYDDTQGAIVVSTILMISICASFGIKLYQILY